jgi:hypothetical protein
VSNELADIFNMSHIEYTDSFAEDKKIARFEPSALPVIVKPGISIAD